MAYDLPPVVDPRGGGFSFKAWKIDGNELKGLANAACAATCIMATSVIKPKRFLICFIKFLKF
jgi:hypothetical protein